MKRRLTLILVDDDPGAIDRMLNLLKPFVRIVVKATFTDPVKALDYLAKNHVDFVLLDMEMPVVGGKAFILQMPKEIEVLLCTGHAQYATDGFDLKVVDFLLKPVEIERLALAIDRMEEKLTPSADSTRKSGGDYYYFMLKGKPRDLRTKVEFNDVVYVEAQDDGSCFYRIAGLSTEIDRRRLTKEKNGYDDRAGAYQGVQAREKMYELNEIFEGTSFMPIHRGFILNTDYFDSYSNRQVTLKGLPGITLPTGERKNYPRFFEYINNHNLPGK